MRMPTKQLTQLGMFLCVCLMLGYLESLLPMPLPIPGMKLGLPNFGTVLLLYLKGPKESALVNLTRILLSGFLFGNLSMILYSLSGAFCSFVIMLLLKKNKNFSVIGVSIGGGILHNLGQLVVAMIVVETYSIAYYFIVLMGSGMITGFIIGILVKIMMPYLARMLTEQ